MNSNTMFVSGHDEIDSHGSQSSSGRCSDGQENSSPNFDDFDDFIASSTLFLNESEACFEPLSLGSRKGRNPSPEHRPPDRSQTPVFQ
ncbi:MAG: hypothetical protein ACRER2_08290 [Methylococcales bacterium]